MPGVPLSSDEKGGLQTLHVLIPEYDSGESHPFSRGERVDKYRLEDLAKPDNFTPPTHWFSQILFLISRYTGGRVPYAFRTTDGQIRSLDAGCIAHLCKQVPPWIDLDVDSSGFIVAVRPADRLREQCEQIGIENLSRHFGVEVLNTYSDADQCNSSAFTDAPGNPLGGEAQPPPFDLDTPVDARRRELSERIRREGAWSFRRDLLTNWHGRCAITGTAVPRIVDAAHIHKYQGLHTNDLSNGLLLRTDVHRLFDFHLLGVHYDTNGRLLFALSHRLSDTAYPQQGEIEAPAEARCRPHPEIVERRWQRYLESEQRRRRWRDRLGA